MNLLYRAYFRKKISRGQDLDPEPDQYPEPDQDPVKNRLNPQHWYF
jgi:hypothetical protein